MITISYSLMYSGFYHFGQTCWYTSISLLLLSVQSIIENKNIRFSWTFLVDTVASLPHLNQSQLSPLETAGYSSCWPLKQQASEQSTFRSEHKHYSFWLYQFDSKGRFVCWGNVSATEFCSFFLVIPSLLQLLLSVTRRKCFISNLTAVQ